VSGAIGRPTTRVDGPAKVTGAARYAAELDVHDLAHAALVLSTVPRGRIAALETRAAEKASGVRAVITHLNAPRLPYVPFDERPEVDPSAGSQLEVFQGPEVLFSGQPIAVVVADTLEQARHAAALVRATYTADDPATTFEARRGRRPEEQSADTRRGAAVKELGQAPVKVDAVYVHPREHHNAIEPHATVAAWEGERLTLHDKTQWVRNDRAEIAHVFGIPEANVRVISPFVGGAFGSALRAWPHVTIAALAARLIGRPVRLELSRRELYTSVGFRPHTEQRVALGALRDGRLTALIHEASAQTSTYEEHTEETVSPSRVTYACPNVLTRYRLVDMNTNTPTHMRAPGVATGLFALECAMDELAVALGIDPVELRLQNHAERDPQDNRPWSSKELRACYAAAAERFGWTRRSREPRSMRAGAWLIGYGMATAVYPAYRAGASAEATVFADGSAVVRSAASDMGPGTYTSMTQVAADALDVPLERVRFELGDSALPDAPTHGGSMTMASVGCAVQAACASLRAKLGVADGRSYAEALRDHGVDRMSATAEVEPGDEAEKFSAWAFGAVFAEVRVDADLGMIRVPRIVGAYDAGRIVNPVTARSQCLGGMVGGLGMALLEQAEWDPRFGRVMNANLAEYLVPVNADVNGLDVVFVPGDDRRFNPLGVKGLAEIGLCGVAPAIANAVYHATGVRVRRLPITLEALL
jgi:xanthine dehydrogenase YagR molybdenum-binding subunit